MIKKGMEIHTVSAGPENRLVLGLKWIKSNEITAIPELLKVLIVRLYSNDDAVGCQKEIVN